MQVVDERPSEQTHGLSEMSGQNADPLHCVDLYSLASPSVQGAVFIRTHESIDLETAQENCAEDLSKPEQLELNLWRKTRR